MITPDTERVLEIHNEVMKNEKLKGVRGEDGFNLLESAINQAFIGFSGEEKYKTPLEKSVRILIGIIKNHPFIDGNKRTAFVAAKELLEEHGETISGYSNKEMANFLEKIASSQENLEKLYKKTLDFLKKYHLK
jgi:death-on-curing protein